MGPVSLLASAVLAASCPSGPVHYGVNAERPSESAPWVAGGVGSQRIVGFVYTYEPTLGDARIREAPGLVVYAGKLHKIAWVPRRWSGTGKSFVIEGRRIDGSGSFRARSTRALAPVFYPSGLTIPSAGCWRLTLRSGTRSWTLHVRAIDRPAAPPCDTSRLVHGPNTGDPPSWIAATPASSGISASFFIPGVDGGAIYTGGRWPNGGNTKILWLVRNGFEPELRIRGVQLDGLGSFRLSAGAVSPPGAYPSTVVVPAPGCWLVVSRIGGRGGAMVVRALAP